MKRKRRTDPAVITYALYLYFNSRSFRLWQPNPWHQSREGAM
ncbi:hypothetical protein Ngar_c09220 [Candidatus Nitrososphaera gargensis Ga9.2]|uniref:Uncharacterized protein n=1 Tax=Nitrososphaera gargensis (strain Ga9.2) TaxID=1237085 RepID=K0IMF7_NITGG|nr:hypothetical protein Ngar_c09220 [Candidatus Nitrososphaera gargensis Ga9.2]